MGIRFECPNGHKLHVKTFLAGKRGICPDCGAKFVIPPSDNGHSDPEPLKSAVAAPGTRTQHGHDAASPEASAVISTVGDREQVAPQPKRIEPLPPPADVGPPILQPRLSPWFVRPPTGGQFGPATDEVFKRWIAEGRVTEDALVWREGWAEWKPAREAGDALPVPLPFVVSSAPIAAPAGPDEAPSAEPIRAEVVAQELEHEQPGQESSASQAVHRSLTRRIRRKQQRRNFAILLLFMTIILAMLLAWVLWRASSVSSATPNSTLPVQLVQSLDGRYVAHFGHLT